MSPSAPNDRLLRMGPPNSVSFEIRPVRPGDVPEMVALAAEAGFESWNTRAFDSEIDRACGRSFVAVEDGVVAYIVGWIVEAEASVLSLAVSIRARRRGIGRALVAHFEGAACESGAEVVVLEVGAQNSARNFYAELGYREVGTRPGYYRAGTEDAVLMERRFASR